LRGFTFGEETTNQSTKRMQAQRSFGSKRTENRFI